MAALPPEKLDRILERFAAVEHGLSSGATGEAFVKLSKDYAELEPAAKAAQELRAAYGELKGLDEMIAAGGELAAMAGDERPVLAERIAGLEHNMRLLLPRQTQTGRHRPACRQQIINQQHSISPAKRILVDVQGVRAVLQIILTGIGRTGQLSRLSHWNKPGTQRHGKRCSKNKTPSLGSHDCGNSLRSPGCRHLLNHSMHRC